MMRRILFFPSSSWLSRSDVKRWKKREWRRGEERRGGGLGSQTLAPLVWKHSKLKKAKKPFTLIHSVKDCFEHLIAVAIAMLLPDRAILTPQHHQLPVTSAQSSKMRDFHNHRSTRRHTGHVKIFQTRKICCINVNMSNRWCLWSVLYMFRSYSEGA